MELDSAERVALCSLGIAFLMVGNWCSSIVPAGPDSQAFFMFARTVSIVVFIVCAFKTTWITRVARSKTILVILGIAAAVGRLLASLQGSIGSGPLISCAGSVLYSAAEPLLLLVWFQSCSLEEPHNIRFIYPSAFAFIAVLYFVLAAMDPRVATAVLCLMPVFSPLLFIYRSSLAAPEAQDGSSDEVSDDDTVEPWKFPLLPTALVVVYGFAFSFSISFGAGITRYNMYGLLVISLLAFALPLRAHRSYSPSLLYRTVLPLMTVGLLLASLSGGMVPIASFLANAAHIAFELFIMITLSEICYRYAIDPVWLFALTQAFSRAAGFAGGIFGIWFTVRFPVGSMESRVAIVVLISLLVTLSVLFFDDRIVSRAFGMEPAENHDDGRPQVQTMSRLEDLVWRCEKVSRQYSLTHREEEVLELLAQGMSTSRVEETLVISSNTAKTHIRHIYDKLDAHSRDDIMKAIESAR